ncbi:MAG TPA: hypothetical protein VHT26_11000 [Trebonia sp.]|jgi:hypothetical protein|nr:hypothetical protein [Trebonia sp.]
MYMWDLLGHDISEGPRCSGVGNDLAAIMRTTEPLLVRRVGFIVRVVEVVSRMSVSHLDVIHVPTGRDWLGRRDIHGGVRWEARYRPVDPGTVYHLAASDDTGAIAS